MALSQTREQLIEELRALRDEAATVGTDVVAVHE